MTEPFKVGILGAGVQAQESRIASMLALAGDGVVVAAVADVDLALAQNVAGKFAVPGSFGIPGVSLINGTFPVPAAFGSLREMLSGVELDGVVICTPTAFHASNACEALSAGVHVLSEKAMAADVAGAQAMLDAADEADRVLAVGYHYPYMHPAVADVVAAGTLGEITHVTGEWLMRESMPDRPGFWNGRFGAGMDLMGHVLSVALPAAGLEPAFVSARTWRKLGQERFGDDFTGDDTMYATVDYAGGARGQFRVSWDCNRSPRTVVTLHGTHGELVIPLMTWETDVSEFVPVLTTVRRVDWTEVGARIESPAPVQTEFCFVKQADDWIRACRGAGRLRFTADHAFAVQVLLNRMYESAAAEGERLAV